jgi:L-malate glycosyltransferase
MKKVLVFSHEFPPFVGGVGTVGYQLSKWMKEEGFQVTVVTRRQPNIREISDVVTHQVRVLPKFWWLSYALFFRSFDLNQFDLIVLNECAPSITAGKFFSDHLLAKSVVLVHGLEIENIYSRGNWLRKLFGFERAHSRAVERARALIQVGLYMREKFLRGSSARISPEKVVTVYTGIDGREFFHEPAAGLAWRQERFIPAEAFVIASGSRITGMKGYREMLDIFLSLCRRSDDVYWVICGDGDLIGFLEEAKARHECLKQRLILEGRCDRDRMRAVYNGSDAFLLLSNYDEALPLAYIEAQMCGLPAIGRNRAGTVETIVDGVSGRLVDSNEEAELVLDDMINGRLRYARDAVIQSAERFEMRSTLKTYLEFV